MKKLEYDYVKQQFEKYGYKLLSRKYENSYHVKLLVKCHFGHQFQTTYNNFQQGKGCPVCFGNQKLTHKFVKQQYEKYGYKLLSEYKNIRARNLVECPKGHQYNVTYHNFQYGQRCPICYNQIRSRSQKLTYEYIKEQIEKEDYKLLSTKYKNVHDKLKVQCPKKHQYEVEYNNFKQGQRCPNCWELEKHSRSEKDCLNVVKQLINENVIENDRNQIVNPNTDKYLELDIYIPSLNKAIEFNGEYWHDSNYSKYKDNQKVKQCKEKKIDLLTIWYNDWIENREEQIQKLKTFLK